MENKHIELSKPIGIFDSGLGGLVVTKAINQLLPQENIIYFGDFANMPYGNKTKSDIQAYCIKACNVLLNQNCKLIVIACNTATVSSFQLIQKYVGKDIPVINAVDPTVSYVAQSCFGRRVGLIATARTVQSRCYEKKIAALAHSNQPLYLQTLATPQLAPMIEDRFLEDSFDPAMIKKYLSHSKLLGIEALILACTHYPLIKSYIDQYYGKKTFVIDSSNLIAKSVLNCLQEKNLLNNQKRKFFHALTSWYSCRFEKIISKLIPDATAVQPLPWKKIFSDESRKNKKLLAFRL